MAFSAILLVSVGRIVVEVGVKGFDLPWTRLPHFISDALIVYTMAYFAFTALFRILLPLHLGVGNVVAAGLLLGITPPVFEALIPSLGGKEKYYDYFFQYELWFYEPTYQPLSETLVVWLAIVGAGVFVALVSRSWWKPLVALLGAWCIFMWGGTIIPSWLVGTHEASLHPDRWIMGAPTLTTSALIFHVSRFRAHLPSLLRLNHVLPFAGLALCGAAYGGHSLGDALWRGGFVLYLCFILLLQNDTYDANEDARAGRVTRASGDDAYWATVLGWILVFYVARVAPMLALTGALVLLIGWTYHHPAARLKQHFCMSYMVEGAGALASFATGLAGALVVASPHPLVWPCVLVFGGGALLSMPKDFKDVDADRAEGIPTLHVQLVQLGRDAASVQRMLAALVTLGLVGASALLGGLYGWTPALVLLMLGVLPTTGVLLWTSRPRASIRLYFAFLGTWLIGASYVLSDLFGLEWSLALRVLA